MNIPNNYPDSDLDYDLYHEEINEAEKKECIYCGDNTYTIENNTCFTCYREYCRLTNN